jgi:DNA repair photolyase
MANNKVKEEYSYPLYVNMQFFFCGVPFRLDTYSGCSHACRYCFARSAENFNQEKVINRGNIRPASVSDIRKMFIKE